jgi:hypothetical protein
LFLFMFYQQASNFYILLVLLVKTIYQIMFDSNFKTDSIWKHILKVHAFVLTGPVDVFLADTVAHHELGSEVVRPELVAIIIFSFPLNARIFSEKGKEFLTMALLLNFQIVNLAQCGDPLGLQLRGLQFAALMEAHRIADGLTYAEREACSSEGRGNAHEDDGHDESGDASLRITRKLHFNSQS